MSMNFDDFWDIVVGSTSDLSPASIAAIRAAFQAIYDLQARSTDAAEIITKLENTATAGQQLSLVAGVNFSTNISAFTITIPQILGLVTPTRTFNVLGQWIAEPIYKTLAHELAHLVLNAKDPAQQLGGQTFEGLTLSNNNPDMDLKGGAEKAANRIASAAIDPL